MAGIRNPHVMAMKAHALLSRGFTVPQVAKLLAYKTTKQLKRALKRMEAACTSSRKRVDDGPAGKVSRRQRDR